MRIYTSAHTRTHTDASAPTHATHHHRKLRCLTLLHLLKYQFYISIEKFNMNSNLLMKWTYPILRMLIVVYELSLINEMHETVSAMHFHAYKIDTDHTEKRKCFCYLKYSRNILKPHLSSFLFSQFCWSRTFSLLHPIRCGDLVILQPTKSHHIHHVIHHSNVFTLSIMNHLFAKMYDQIWYCVDFSHWKMYASGWIDSEPQKFGYPFGLWPW